MSQHARADKKLLKKNMTNQEYIEAVDSTINKKIDNILTSDKAFHEMLLLADEKDLLDKALTDKQRATFQMILDADSLCRSFTAQSNTLGSTFKVNAISSGNHHSPLQMSNDASKKIIEARQEFMIAHKILRERKLGKKIYTYMITLTVKNARKDTLKKEVKKLKDAMKKLAKRLSIANKRKNNALLISSFEEEVEYLGGIYSIEIVVNEDRLLNLEKKDLFNHHIHFLIMTNVELDIDETSEKIYSAWDDINKKMKVKTDRQAFDMQKAYDKDANDMISNADSMKYDIKMTQEQTASASDMSAFREVVKYATKPSVYNAYAKIMCDGDDKQKAFAVEVFAEYYNTVHNAHQQVKRGIMKEAASFRKKHKDIINALFANEQFAEFGEFADIMTTEREMKRDEKTNKINMLSKRDLFNAEIIFYNRSMIENVLLRSEARERLEALIPHATDKELFDLKIMTSFDTLSTIDEYYQKIDDKIIEFDKAKEFEKALAQAESSIEDLENLERKEEMINFKKEDLIKLRNALECEFSMSGKARVHNFSRQMKSEQRRILFDLFKSKHEHASLEEHEMFEQVVQSLKLTSDSSSDTVELDLFAQIDNSFYAKHFPNAYKSLIEFESDMENLNDVIDDVQAVMNDHDLVDPFALITSLDSDEEQAEYDDFETYVLTMKIEKSSLKTEYTQDQIDKALVKIDELALV